jgi:RHS repeat-associated protein
MIYYYPFGLKHKGYNSNVSSRGNSVAQKFKYNGIELDESLGLNLYEMDVRSYDPAIARFTSIDPVVHHYQSTYAAFDNNPVFWSDPSGADSEPFFRSRFLNKNGGFWSDLMLDNNNNKKDDNDKKNKDKKDKEEFNVLEYIEKTLANAPENSATIINFNKNKFQAIIDVFNQLMILIQFNLAVEEVFANDFEKQEKFRILQNVSLEKTNSIVGKYSTSYHGTVEFDDDYNIVGKGNGDYFINYSGGTNITDYKTVPKSWGLGQDTFTAGWVPIYFKHYNRTSANFIGFRTVGLREKYIKHFEEYRKVFIKTLKNIK